MYQWLLSDNILYLVISNHKHSIRVVSTSYQICRAWKFKKTFKQKQIHVFNFFMDANRLFVVITLPHLLAWRTGSSSKHCVSLETSNTVTLNQMVHQKVRCNFCYVLKIKIFLCTILNFYMYMKVFREAERKYLEYYSSKSFLQ